jgi:hypothetical protein
MRERRRCIAPKRSRVRYRSNDGPDATYDHSMRILRWIVLLPFRLVALAWNIAIHGQAFPDKGESYEQRVAAREARKRVERHGTE